MTNQRETCNLSAYLTVTADSIRVLIGFPTAPKLRIWQMTLLPPAGRGGVSMEVRRRLQVSSCVHTGALHNTQNTFPLVKNVNKWYIFMFFLLQ